MDREQARQVVEQWKRAAPELEKVREQDIRGSDTVQAMEILGGCIDMAIRDLPPRPTSGLMELQRWLGRLRSAPSADRTGAPA